MILTFILAVYVSGILVTWVIRHFVLSWTLKHDPVLTTTMYEHTIETPLRLSVVVPARNEEHNIGECLDSLLAQDYASLSDGSHFEIIVVDDRSEDRTAEIVQDRVRRDGRVKLIRTTELPEGWTGKNHALHLGAQAASRPEFLLFTDADTRHHPRNLSVAMTFAVEHKTDMLSLLIPILNVTFWEKVIQPLTGSMLGIRYPIWKVNDPTSSIAFGNGQYILIRRDAYEGIGGHEAVRDKLLEDIAIARLIKESGRSLKMAYAGDVSRIRMYRSLSEIWHGWARIFFAGMNRSLSMMSVGVLLMLVFSLSPYFIFIGTAARLVLDGTSWMTWTLLAVSGVTIAVEVSMMARFYRTFQTDARYIAIHFMGCLVALGILLSAIGKLYSRRGLIWKGTRYETRPRL